MLLLGAADAGEKKGAGVVVCVVSSCIKKPPPGDIPPVASYTSEKDKHPEFILAIFLASSEEENNTPE